MIDRAPHDAVSTRAARRTLVLRVGALAAIALMTRLPLLDAKSAPTAAPPLTRSNRTGQLRLDNGLQAVWEEDRRQPLVAIEARIKGGMRGEGRYLGTGVTHFLEHMLFKGTTTRAPGTIDQEVRRYGGTINAFTSFDTTGVSLFVESRYVKDALGMLADILQHAVFPPEEFEKEREVVRSEIQMNQDDPQRWLNHIFWERHFLEHPYRIPILGYPSLLEKLTVQDMADYYAAQYQPQNITVACSGDLDAATFGELVNTAFGGWARGRLSPEQQVVPQEPPTVSPKEVVVERPVQTAYAMLGWTSTSLADPRTYPLDVLASILGQGKSSRLYEQLVRQQQVVDSIQAWNYTPNDPGVLNIQFRTAPDKLPAATQAIRRILDELIRSGVTTEELEKAKRAVAADYYFNLQTVEAKAGDLASSFAATGDPLFSRRYVAGINAVTAEDVKTVAADYLAPERMTTAIIRPPAAAAPAAGVLENHAVEITKHVLKNGATVLLGVDHHLPITGLVVGFRGGVRVESSDQEGLSNFVAHLLTKGTSKHSAFDIAKQVESLGGNLEAFSGKDGLGLVLQVLAQDADRGLALLHELVTDATFPPQEIEIQRKIIAMQLKAQDDEMFDVGGRLLRRTLFPSHPYRFTPLGRHETIPTLTRAACVDFTSRWLVPSNMVIAAFGDIDPAAMLARIERTFGTRKGAPAAWPASLPESPLQGITEASQTMEKEQAVILLGFRGTTHTAPDRYAVDVLTAALSGMAGRLFQTVREEHGLSYTLGASHVPGWDPGYVLVYAATRPEEQGPVLKILEEQLALITAEGITAEELDQAKRYLIGGHRMELQHVVGLARQSALDELYGLGYDAWRSYEQRINAVTQDDVRAAATRYLTLEQRAQVVVSPKGGAP